MRKWNYKNVFRVQGNKRGAKDRCGALSARSRMDNVAVDMSKKVDLSKKLETREDFGRVQYLSKFVRETD